MDDHPKPLDGMTTQIDLPTSFAVNMFALAVTVVWLAAPLENWIVVGWNPTNGTGVGAPPLPTGMVPDAMTPSGPARRRPFRYWSALRERGPELHSSIPRSMPRKEFPVLSVR